MPDQTVETTGVIPEVSPTFEQTTESQTTVDEGQVLESQETQPVVEPEHVPVAALQAEREKLQFEAEKAEFYRKMLEAERSRPQPQQPEIPQTPQYLPDQVLTAGEIEQVIAQNLAPLNQSLREQIVNAQVAEAKAKYPDYAEVLEYADRLATVNPRLKDFIFSTDNPAETAYRLGRGSDEYIQKLISKSTNQVVDKINNNLAQPKTVTGAGGITQKAAASKYETMPDDEFSALVEKVKAGQYQS